MPLLEIHQLKKSFASPDEEVRLAVDVPSFSLSEREQAALSGESGSGKTTFLNLISGILPADSGTIRIAGREMTALSEAERDRLRASKVGYIFQTFNLLQGFTCLENILLGMSFGGGKPDRRLAKRLLERVGLRKRTEYYPRQLSIGQQQRIAAARALASRPSLVLADEPTGNLDSANAKEALSLIRETCEENGAALLLVSHDPTALEQFASRKDFSAINRGEREE